MEKFKAFVKKWWGLIFVPIGLFVVGLLVPRASRSEMKEEVKEAKAEVKEAIKEVEEVKAEITETVEQIVEEEKVLENTVEEIEARAEEGEKEQIAENAKLEMFLPGLKK